MVSRFVDDVDFRVVIPSLSETFGRLEAACAVHPVVRAVNEGDRHLERLDTVYNGPASVCEGCEDVC